MKLQHRWCCAGLGLKSPVGELVTRSDWRVRHSMAPAAGLGAGVGFILAAGTRCGWVEFLWVWRAGCAILVCRLGKW